MLEKYGGNSLRITTSNSGKYGRVNGERYERGEGKFSNFWR